MATELFPGLELSEKKLKSVLIGCGEQATNLIHDAIAYIDAIEVVAVCDLNKERADFAAKRFGLDHSYQDMDQMFHEVDAQAAFVVMVPKLQAKISRNCLEVFLYKKKKKPLGTELEDIYALGDCAKRMGKKIGVSFNKRYALAYQDMKRAIESDGFGAPSAYIAKFIGGYRSTPTDLLRTGSCHFFDLGRHLIGETDELFAYKYEKAPGQHIFAITAQFENGCVGSLTMGSMGSWACGFGMEGVEVRGDRNMVWADNGRDFTWQKPAKILNSYSEGASNQNTQAIAEEAVPVEITRPNYSNIGKLTMSNFYINGNFQCIKGFVNAVLNDEEPPVGYSAGLMALKIALAIEKSVAEKRAIKLTEIN